MSSRFTRGLCLALLLLCGTTSDALATPPGRAAPRGKVFLTLDEALALAFPDCTVERRTEYLSDAQKRRIAKLAKVDFERNLAFPYVATRKGELVGTAYFDTHRVRTLRETLMVVVTPEGTIARIEVLAFAEPPDYIPRASWYAQFPGHDLDGDLQLKRGIRGVTGATLTARATTNTARRVLALHQVLSAADSKDRQ